MTRRESRRIPRLYAAASLKHDLATRSAVPAGKYSAALCRGLIEARACSAIWRGAASVFRGSMPRPH